MLDLLQLPFVGAVVIQSCTSGHRFDATNAGGDASLADDLEDANLGRVPNVRAATELHADTGDRHDAHDVAILFGE